ncbi:MAG: hypothetical protein ACOCWC_02920 [Bacteroidota bacterium]
MKVFNSIEEAGGKIKNAVVTIGSFDGVHIGHKVIIDRLKKIAQKNDGESVLITFYPHPRKVISDDKVDLKLINSQQEKIYLLEKAGLDNLIIHPFSKDFSKISSYDFISEFLIAKLKAKVIVVGKNHHFGHNRQGDYSHIYDLSKKFNFQVEEIPLKDIDKEIVSSGKVREALAHGNIKKANSYLGYQYFFIGQLSPDSSISNLNVNKSFDLLIDEADKIVPPQSIYAASLLIDNKHMKAMLVVLEKPNGNRTLSIVLLEGNIEVVNQKVSLVLFEKVKSLDNTMVDILNLEVSGARCRINKLNY